MNNNYFRLKFRGKEVDLDIESSQLQLWKADQFNEDIGLFINIETKGKDIEFFDEDEHEPYQSFMKPRIFTEWLEIPVQWIKNKDFRTLETVSIDFKDSKEIAGIDRLIWTEAPGALYVHNHGMFEKVKIDFKYLGDGSFNVKLDGIAEFDTPFEVSADIPFEIELKAYNNRASKEDIVSFFEKLLNPDEFNYEWRFRDEDIFFKAKPKELRASLSP